MHWRRQSWRHEVGVNLSLDADELLQELYFHADLPLEEVVEGDQPVPALPESLEVTAEIGGRARPALLGHVDLVVLEDHDAPELVRGKIASRGRPGQERPGHEGDDAEKADHA